MVLDDVVRQHIESKIVSCLERISPYIQRVTIHLADLNGPRGGQDKTCRLEARISTQDIIIVEDTDAILYSAVDRAIDKLQRAILRSVKRSKTFDRSLSPRLALRYAS
jgi:ribosome-associated translation inhibitor RaiA